VIFFIGKTLQGGEIKNYNFEKEVILEAFIHQKWEKLNIKIARFVYFGFIV
jgi:hypothetical protein